MKVIENENNFTKIQENSPSLRRQNEKLLENLSDCLQEIFDKYHIIHFNSPNSDYFYPTWSYRIIRNRYEIVIENIKNFKNSILSDIRRSQKTIEARIYSPIYIIEKNPNLHQGPRIIIRLSDPIKEGINISNTLIEDLSEYLQEIFDRNNFKNIEIPTTNTYENMGDNTWAVAQSENNHFYYGCIYIKTTEETYQKILSDITQNKTKLEKRLKKQVIIWFSSTYNMITVSIPGDKNKILHKSFPYIKESIRKNKSLFELQRPLSPFPSELDYINYTLDADGKLKPQLEDCLIETFDKFNIPQREKNSKELSWCGDYYGYLIIKNIPLIKFHDIFEEIVKIHPIIEKRIKAKVYISASKQNDQIFICAALPRNKSLNESNTVVENLEDYLQEIFDKYHIKSVSKDDIFLVQTNKNNNIYCVDERKITIRCKEHPWSERPRDSDIIEEDIDNIISILEKRMGCKIYTNYLESGYRYIILIPEIKNIKNIHTYENFIHPMFPVSNSKSRERMESLSEYLQEFFDKNQIKKREENITLMPGLYWHIDKNFIYIRNRSVDDKFPDESEYDKLYDEIFEMRSYIGKRLGRSINIYQYTTFPGIDISIINND